MKFFCVHCGLEGVNPIWIKIKAWRDDLRTFRKEAVPVHKECSAIKSARN